MGDLAGTAIEVGLDWQSSTMRLDTRPGETVRFLGKNGYDFELAEALEVLTPGALYTVRSVEVGPWSSVVVLDEGSFNTVMFANDDGGLPC